MKMSDIERMAKEALKIVTDDTPIPKLPYHRRTYLILYNHVISDKETIARRIQELKLSPDKQQVLRNAIAHRKKILRDLSVILNATKGDYEWEKVRPDDFIF